MIRLLAFLLLSLWPGLATAQDAPAATLRSGEHDGFTRLAFRAEGRTSWRLSRAGPRVVRIAFAPTPAMTLSPDIYARIRRDRVRAVEIDSGTLAVTLGCDCGIDIRQLASGFVAIDIVDGTGPVRSRANRAAALPLRLDPLSLPRVAVGFDLASAGHGDAEEAHGMGDVERPSQIDIRPGGLPELVRADIPLEGCALERRAAETLAADPVAALAEARLARGGVADAAGGIDEAALRAQGALLLEAGFGREADAILGSTGLPRDAADRRLARALDGEGGDAIAALATCGPAVSVLDMLMRPDAQDHLIDTDLIAFLDALPPARQADLIPRLAPLRRSALGRGWLDARGAEGPPSSGRAAAGTGREAVEASIARLEGPAQDDPQMGLLLENALALRSSVPEGELRDRLDRIVLRRLLERGHLSNAADLLRRAPALGEDAVRLALASLPPPQAVEALARLEPHLPPDAGRSDEAASLLRRYGLDRLARRYAPPGAPGPVAPNATPPELAAWMAGDMDGASARPETPRGALARELVSQRDAVAMPGVFEASRQAVEDAARLLDALRPVVDAPDRTDG